MEDESPFSSPGSADRAQANRQSQPFSKDPMRLDLHFSSQGAQQARHAALPIRSTTNQNPSRPSAPSSTSMQSRPIPPTQTYSQQPNEYHGFPTPGSVVLPRPSWDHRPLAPPSVPYQPPGSSGTQKLRAAIYPSSTTQAPGASPSAYATLPRMTADRGQPAAAANHPISRMPTGVHNELPSPMMRTPGPSYPRGSSALLTPGGGHGHPSTPHSMPPPSPRMSFGTGSVPMSASIRPKNTGFAPRASQSSLSANTNPATSSRGSSPVQSNGLTAGEEVEIRRRRQSQGYGQQALDGMLGYGTRDNAFVEAAAPSQRFDHRIPLSLATSSRVPSAAHDAARSSVGTQAANSSAPSGNENLHGAVKRFGDGLLYFRAWGARKWEPTTTHEANREAMIRDMSQYGAYVHRPTEGSGRHDVTSYLQAQRLWRFDGGWDPSQDDILYRLERADLPTPEYEAGPLRWRGQVVLTNQNKPINDWRNMPLTISSKIEGGKLEHICREDCRISTQDFRDRMPSRSGNQKLQGVAAFGNRRVRFREAYGLIAWNPKEGSKALSAMVRSHLTEDQIRRNTTEGFNGLTQAEIHAHTMRNAISGRYKKKAGKRALPQSLTISRVQKAKAVRSRMRRQMPNSEDEEEEEDDEDEDEEEDEFGEDDVDGDDDFADED